MIRRRADLFAAGMWGFLLTITLGTAYAIWLGTGFFPALRLAEMEFGAVLANGDVATYPSFVARVVDTWPERLAASPADGAGALRTVLFIMSGVGIYLLLHEAPIGSDLDSEMRADPHKTQILEKIRALSRYRGRLLRRSHGSESVGTADAVYLGEGICGYLDRKLQTGVAERLAFTVVHERAHLASADNALWSLGAINALLVAGLSAALLVQPVLYAVMIAMPDETVRALPYTVTIVLAVVIAVLCMGVIGSLPAGLLAAMRAAREYFADARAAAVIGAAHHPYVGCDDPGRVGDASEAWKSVVAPHDRRLHLRGMFPRTGALAAFAVGVWMLARTGLAVVSGLRYGAAAAAFDIAAAAALGTMLGALPRRGAGARSYDALPWAVVLAVLGLLAASYLLIDSFAARFGLAPLFGTQALLALVVPVAAAVVLAAAWLHCDPRPPSRAGGIDARRPRWGLKTPLLFLMASPAWATSYVLAGLCLFQASGTVTDFLRSSSRTGWLLLADLAVSAACCGLFALIAWNVKSPSRRSTVAEVAVSVPLVTAAFYLSLAIYAVLAAGSATSDGDDLVKRLLAMRPEDLPALGMVLGFAGVLSLSWWARSRLKRWQVGPEDGR